MLSGKPHTVGVVLEINDESAGEYLGNPDYYNVDGEYEGDGVYILTREELKGYPSGKRGFRPAN